MELKELIKKEIEKIPIQYLPEVLDFIHFLETKAMDGTIGTAIASEASLKKSWLRPEEDEAWKDL